MILQTGLTPTPEDEEDHDRHRPADGQKRDPQGLEPLGEGSLEPSVLEDLEASGFVPSPPQRRTTKPCASLPSTFSKAWSGGDVECCEEHHCDEFKIPRGSQQASAEPGKAG